MKYIVVIFLFVICHFGKAQQAELIINEVLFETNELEIKNIGSSSINLVNTFIQSTGNSMTITTATDLTCSGFTLQPGETAVVPIPYPVVSTGGDFMILQDAQIATAYLQWGGVQGFATLAFAEGIWDNPEDFVPAALANESIILIDENERKDPSGWLTIGESSPCEDNDQCEISDVIMSDLECLNNGTFDDPTDDEFIFFLDIEGLNLPDMINLSITGGTVDPPSISSSCNDCMITSAPGMANGEEYVLTATSSNNQCLFSQTFIAPNSCSTECNMQNSQVIILGCLDNDTSDDPSDDYIELIARPFGFNLADEYYVEFSFGNVEGPFINATPFSVISTEGFYVPGSGDFSVTIIDGDDDFCTQTIDVIDQEGCSPNCVLDIDSLEVRCDNGGSLYDDTDDFYVLDIQAASSASASGMYQASIDPFLPIPQLLENDVLYSFSSAPGSTNVINTFTVTVLDPDYPECIGITIHGMLNEGCLTECEIFPADIALEEAPLICLEPEDESIFTFEVINGIVMDTFLLLALNELDEIVFISDKLSFDAREFEAGIYQFVVVHFIELSGVELGVGIDRLKGCFALSPYISVEIVFQEMCTTSTKEYEKSFSIYPNPITNIVCIEAKWPINKVTVLDLTGKVVHSESSDHCIDLSHLESGVYWIKNEDNSSVNSIVQRFVKM